MSSKCKAAVTNYYCSHPVLLDNVMVPLQNWWQLQLFPVTSLSMFRKPVRS
jgi:hypothetical protein